MAEQARKTVSERKKEADQRLDTLRNRLSEQEQKLERELEGAQARSDMAREGLVRRWMDELGSFRTELPRDLSSRPTHQDLDDRSVRLSALEDKLNSVAQDLNAALQGGKKEKPPKQNGNGGSDNLRGGTDSSSNRFELAITQEGEDSDDTAEKPPEPPRSRSKGKGETGYEKPRPGGGPSFGGDTTDAYQKRINDQIEGILKLCQRMTALGGDRRAPREYSADELRKFSKGRRDTIETLLKLLIENNELHDENTKLKSQPRQGERDMDQAEKQRLVEAIVQLQRSDLLQGSSRNERLSLEQLEKLAPSRLTQYHDLLQLASELEETRAEKARLEKRAEPSPEHQQDVKQVSRQSEAVLAGHNDDLHHTVLRAEPALLRHVPYGIVTLVLGLLDYIGQLRKELDQRALPPNDERRRFVERVVSKRDKLNDEDRVKKLLVESELLQAPNTVVSGINELLKTRGEANAKVATLEADKETAAKTIKRHKMWFGIACVVLIGVTLAFAAWGGYNYNRNLEWQAYESTASEGQSTDDAVAEEDSATEETPSFEEAMKQLEEVSK